MAVIPFNSTQLDTTTTAPYFTDGWWRWGTICYNSKTDRTTWVINHHALHTRTISHAILNNQWYPLQKILYERFPQFIRLIARRSYRNNTLDRRFISSKISSFLPLSLSGTNSTSRISSLDICNDHHMMLMGRKINKFIANWRSCPLYISSRSCSHRAIHFHKSFLF